MFKKQTLFLTLCFFVCVASAAKPKTDKEKYSYALGFMFATQLKNQKIDLSNKAIIQAVNDVLDGKKPQLTQEEMRNAFSQLTASRQKEMAALAKKNKEAGEKFLKKNKSKGFKSLKSGIQYKVIKSGKGKQPKKTDTVLVHYKGTFIDGKVFDQSQKGKPAQFQLNRVISGWQEILPMMKTGAKWKVVIPSNLAYGPRGHGNIPPNSTLIFEIELKEVKG